METAFVFLICLLAVVLINRAIIYIYFNGAGFFKLNRKPLNRNNIDEFRNSYERSGITPGGVSWQTSDGTFSPERAESIARQRVSRPVYKRKIKGQWKAK